MPVTWTVTRRDSRQFTTAGGAVNFTVRVGARGAAGPGVPAGGSTAERLKKLSGTDYDTGWGVPAQMHVPSIASPSAGTTYPVTSSMGLVGTFLLRRVRAKTASGALSITVVLNGVDVGVFAALDVDAGGGETIAPSAVTVADGGVLAVRVDSGSATGLSLVLSE